MRFEQLHNYYERLVIRRIMQTLVTEGEKLDTDYLEDVACVALNQLPARYVRHEVDLAFYMPTEERLAMERAVDEAVRMATRFVDEHRDDTQRPRTITVEA